MSGFAAPRTNCKVHRIELEIQNEELHRPRADLETRLDRYTDLTTLPRWVISPLTPDGYPYQVVCPDRPKYGVICGK